MSQAREKSQIRDFALAEQGELKIDWVREHMPLLRQLEEQFRQTQPFAGKRISMCLHLEAKTAYLALVVQAGVQMWRLPRATRSAHRTTWLRVW